MTGTSDVLKELERVRNCYNVPQEIDKAVSVAVLAVSALRGVMKDLHMEINNAIDPNEIRGYSVALGHLTERAGHLLHERAGE